MVSGPMRFAVVGDTTLDVTVRGGTPAAGSDRQGAISTGPGGQGANVAIRLARRGAAVRLVTAIGTDPAGSLLAAMLAAEGLAIVNLGSVSSGVVVSLVDPTGERAMVSDRVSLDPDQLESSLREAMGNVDWIHVSGYPLADPGSGDVLAAALSRRTDQRCGIGGGSFDQSSAPGISARLRLARPDIVQFDRAEAAVALVERGADANARSAEALATALATELAAVAVVTDGVAGASAATSDGVVSVVGPAGAGQDATGAGDAHAASILLGLASGTWPPTLASLRGALEDAGAVGGEVAATIGAQARLGSEGTA